MPEETKKPTDYSKLIAACKRKFSIEIGSHTVPVYTYKGLEDDHDAKGMAVMFPEYAIILAAGLSKEDSRRTLLHEAFHIISEMYALDFPEQLVLLLEQSVFQVIRQRRL